MIDVGGWIGVALLLIAYALVSTRRLAGDSTIYQLLNVARERFAHYQFVFLWRLSVCRHQYRMDRYRSLRFTLETILQ